MCYNRRTKNEKEGKEMKHDPVEDTPEYKAIEEELEALIQEEMSKQECFWWNRRFIYWSLKKRILLEKYGIYWRSPSQMNPHLRF